MTVTGITGNGWPPPSLLDQPRWTDTQIKRAVAVALDAGRRFERHRIATAMAELDASERLAGARAYAEEQRAAREALEARAAASGRVPWVGVGHRWRPWTPVKAEIYRSLIDSWREEVPDAQPEQDA